MTDNNKRIVVLMGGVSLEHEVSLRSGQGVMNALTASGYEPVGTTLQQNGLWRFPETEPVSVPEAATWLSKMAPACVFIALHGTNGEDGRIQGFLDCLGFPYTGSGCAASALSIDKIRAKAVVSVSGITAARHFVVEHDEWTHNHAAIVHQVEDRMGFPVVVKAPSQGSSCGMAISLNAPDFTRDVNEIISLENVVMVERYVKGLEVTCGVLDIKARGNCQALPITEIHPNTSAFFDYYAKYTPDACREITPARIGEQLTRKVQDAAVAAHVALGCRSWSRSDFIIDDKGPVWLEINTVPGLTETSLFPQAAAAVGISYNDLICLLVEDAIHHHQEQHSKD